MKLFLILLLLVSGRAFAYGHEGHQAVAEAARTLLQPSARKAIARILGDDDLAQVATWPDQLKQAKKHQGPLANDREARAFNSLFPNNGNWHFLDLPLGTPVYSDAGEFSGENDIVHEINECIKILETRPPQATRFEKKQALRFLVHLVGDIHQPLHVGTGYYDLSKPVPVLIEDPQKAYRHPNDKGANFLRYGATHFDELHGYWDDTLVEQVARTDNYEKLALDLESHMHADAWKTPGDYHQWAEQWATDSVHEARKAYTGIVFESAERNRHGKLKQIRIRLPENYERDQLNRARDQLCKAGLHLALLLNSIRW